MSNTGINVQAAKVKVQGTAVIRRADGSIKAELTFEGEAPAENFLPEVNDNGTGTGSSTQERTRGRD